MSLTRDDVLHVARLARLGLSDEEVERMQRQLSLILEHFEMLRRLDTDDVPPTFQVFAATNVFREDEPRPSFPVEEVLQNAPLREGDYFRVRAVLEE
ncbi:MAG: Asp-tRNA(Asn)/Glu-tRNA(Gln) amidotransferase subunit GatC [Chloroflexota bacterium]|nr:Asp-tRNA(Asn)/Glu-tRNA(Gln) amidotransferase subunit GatC [Dehalococcoidia bacterium]MDW8254909.1 Asp-tRNA(Asn)/Glu-tRNA(Gln) amidotransferase subunit GatC [Chloroflexota bacterium]